MHRTISNYKITKRKDGRDYVRLQDGAGLPYQKHHPGKLVTFMPKYLLCVLY